MSAYSVNFAQPETDLFHHEWAVTGSNRSPLGCKASAPVALTARRFRMSGTWQTLALVHRGVGDLDDGGEAPLLGSRR
jgi:hypothetical protein